MCTACSPAPSRLGMGKDQQQKIKIHSKADLKTLNTICTFSAFTSFSRQQTERVVLTFFFFLQVNNERNESVGYILEIIGCDLAMVGRIFR